MLSRLIAGFSVSVAIAALYDRWSLPYPIKPAAGRNCLHADEAYSRLYWSERRVFRLFFYRNAIAVILYLVVSNTLITAW